MTWRWISEDGVPADAGLAGDEMLARRVGDGSSPATLRLYTYRPHAALVGRFQDASIELHLDRCRARDIAVNRRPTGGGAILMGPDQLGVALALAGRDAGRLGSTGRLRERMARFSDGLVRALNELGVSAKFRGKNDLEVGGRKVAGLGLYRDVSGGLLFHASLLVDLDVPLMAEVLRLPFETTTSEDLRALAGRTCTLRHLVGGDLALDEVRACVAEGFAASFDVALAPGAFDGRERDTIEELVATKYGTEAWVHRASDVQDRTGSASLRTPGGRIDAHVSLAGRTLKSVHLRGDFFEDEAAVADLEARLRWHSSHPDALARTVAEWALSHPDGTLPPSAVDRVLAQALERSVPGHAARPYGCFATPRSDGTSEREVLRG